MIGTYVAPHKTRAAAIDVARYFREATRKEVGIDLTPRALAVLVAQSALESGHWASMWCHNFGNVKASGNWPGLYTCIRLNEVIDGKLIWFSPDTDGHSVPPGHPQTRMRAFHDGVEGARDHIRFLAIDTTPDNGKPNRYAAAWAAAVAGDPVAFAAALKRSGYYTASEVQYTRAVTLLTKKFEPLCEPSVKPPVQLDKQDEDDLVMCQANCMRTELPAWLRARVAMLTATTLDWESAWKAGRDAQR